MIEVIPLQFVCLRALESFGFHLLLAKNEQMIEISQKRFRIEILDGKVNIFESNKSNRTANFLLNATIKTIAEPVCLLDALSSRRC